MTRHSRARQERELRRRPPQRPRYDRLLIACEGEKTEPLYLDAIRIQLRVPSTHITVLPSALGTQPRQVVDFAEAEFSRTREYDRVFAVFDRDEHPTYHDALDRATKLNGVLKNDERRAIGFSAVPSVPCFEIWLLLHYEEVHGFGHRADILEKLKRHIPGYAKGARGIYELTEPKLAEAMTRAAGLKQRFTAVAGTDPFTDIHELVERLRSVRGRM